MSLKDLKKAFWNPGDEVDETPQPDIPDTTVRKPSSTPLPVASSLAALRNGPSASIFTKVSGMSSLSTPAPNVAVKSSAVDAESDAVIMASLDQDSKEPGFKEFMTQCTAMSGIIRDKKQCIAAALAGVSAMNPRIDASQIARAVGERLRLLSGYESAYADECKNREREEMQDMSNTLIETSDRMKEVESEIARLAGERAQLEVQTGNIEKELAGVEQKYAGHLAKFSGSVEARRAELKEMLGFVAPKPMKEGE